MRVSLWTIAILVTIRLFVVAASTPSTRVLAADVSHTDTGSAALLPMPASIKVSGSSLVSVHGRRVDVELTGHDDKRVEDSLKRFASYLHNLTGVRVDVKPFKRYDPKGMVFSSFDSVLTDVIVDCSESDAGIQSVNDDESYAMDIGPNTTRIWAKTPLGALRGLATLRQLIQPRTVDFATLPRYYIVDSPRFKWRGLLLDCSRHFEPVDVLKTNLDYMERCKLNVFHWHLSDDQGFRVESKVFPKLTELGSDGDFYTQKQIKEVIAYARDRGIRVVPEFDMPGHSTSWFVGYPELASAPGPYSIQRNFGVFDPAMDPTREETYDFLDKFIGEMAGLFPDAWFHIGGDEVNGHQWDGNPRIQDFIKAHGMKSNADLQAYFNSRVYTIVAKHGKKMMGWDEVLQPGIPGEIAIQSWRGRESLDHAAELGHPTILSSGYYLDWLEPAATYYAVDPMAGSEKLSTEDRARIMGGEACMWGESIDEHTAIGRIWPRAAAVAERLWSPETVTDPASLSLRLAQFDPRTTVAEAPFHDTPAAIPGTVEVADYDLGGEGVSYHDTADYNAGGAYRRGDNVFIGTSKDSGSTAVHQVEYMVAGEWLKYTVDVKQAGAYVVHIRAASDAGDARFHFEDASHKRLGDDIAVPKTGGWQKWATVDGTVELPLGRQTITLVEDTGGYNLGLMTFERRLN